MKGIGILSTRYPTVLADCKLTPSPLLVGTRTLPSPRISRPRRDASLPGVDPKLLNGNEVPLSQRERRDTSHAAATSESGAGTIHTRVFGRPRLSTSACLIDDQSHQSAFRSQKGTRCEPWSHSRFDGVPITQKSSCARSVALSPSIHAHQGRGRSRGCG